MSRLNDLLRQLRLKDAAMADDLQREVDNLADRRAFGLNFERHVPEAVELPGRPLRHGDKVRIMPPRGTLPTKAGDRLWRVLSITADNGAMSAALEALDGDETDTAEVDDIVVVAEFRDNNLSGPRLHRQDRARRRQALSHGHQCRELSCPPDPALHPPRQSRLHLH